jgi:hypothetical protein
LIADLFVKFRSELEFSVCDDDFVVVDPDGLGRRN